MRLSFSRALSRVVFAVSAVLVAGCAALPATAPESIVPSREALDDFVIDGRFSLRQNEQNYSGRLHWKHTGESDEILLSSPFGQGLAEIVAGAGNATLTTGDGKTYSANDAESLMDGVLGYRLPLPRLADWIRARVPAEGVTERDALGRPLGLRESDWRVTYDYDGDAPDAPPVNVFAERSGAFELRLHIDTWTRLP